MSNPIRLSIRSRQASVLAASLALALAGCATPVLKPALDVPARFAAASASADEPADAWWEGFKDPALSDLIRRAAQQNRDVKIALERVRAARAGETVSRSWLFPSVSVQGAGFDHRTGYDSATKRVVSEAADTKGWQGGLAVSWEIDLAGRLRAGAAAAAADTLAAEDMARGVRLLVVTDVATNYFTLVGALRQLDTVRAISAAQDETLRLVTARERAGLATPFDVERAQTEASRARAAIPPLETLAAVSRHRIAVLIGDQAFNAASIAPSHADITVPAARPGQPADLLQRRPDLLAAQAQLDAANARRQQAMAEWFPRLFLGAVFGRESVSVNGIGTRRRAFHQRRRAARDADLQRGTHAGDQRHRRERSEAKPCCATRTPLCARSRTSRTRSSRSTTNGNARKLLQSAAASADAALGRAQSLYDRGQIDLLPLLDAQRARLTVRVSANDGNTQLLLDSVQLYKALGGGWQVFEPVGDADRRRHSAFPEFMNPSRPIRGTVVKPSFRMALIPLSIAATAVRLLARSRHPEPLRAVRTVEIRYDKAQETNRYFGSVQSRHEVDQAFRVGGKVVSRKVDVGQKVRQGDVIAVLDDTRLQAGGRGGAATADGRGSAGAAGRVGSEAAQCVEDGRLGQPVRRRESAEPRANDRAPPPKRKRASSSSRAIVSKYTVLRASQDGVVTSVHFEVGPGRGRRPAGRLDREGGRAGDRRQRARGPACRYSRRRGTRRRSRARPTRRSRSCCANCRRRRRRRRARSALGLKPATTAPAAARRDRHARRRPPGRRQRRRPRSPPRRSRRTRVSRRSGSFAAAGAEPVGTVELLAVAVHGYRNDEVLVSGPPAGELVVTAGVQKMAPGSARSRFPPPRPTSNRSRPRDEVVQPHRMGAEPPRHRAVPDPRDHASAACWDSRSSASSKTRSSRCLR